MHCCVHHICQSIHSAVAEQVGVVDGYQAGSLLLRTAQVAVTAMQEFQVSRGLGRSGLNPRYAPLLERARPRCSDVLFSVAGDVHRHPIAQASMAPFLPSVRQISMFAEKKYIA